MPTLTKEQNNKRKISKIKNELLNLCQVRDEKVLEIQELSLHSFREKKKNIEIEVTLFGNKVIKNYDSASMLSFIRPYPYIAEFIKNNDFNSLLNGYFIGVMTNIASIKCRNKYEGSMFDTDICLYILFTMTYCTQELVEELMLKLKLFKEYQIEEGETPIFYSAFNLLPMIYYFYNKWNPNKKFPLDFNNSIGLNKLPLNNDIYENISPEYKSIISNLYTDDTKKFNNIVVEMCNYHLENSKDNYLLEFNNIIWQYFPIEILFLLKERYKNGLSIEGISHPLIDDFLPYFLNDFEISEQNKKILELIL